MSRPIKTDRETIRFTPEQSRRLSIAAKILSRRKGEIVEPGPLLRDMGLPHIKAEILDTATESELAQAEADLEADERPERKTVGRR